MNFKSNLKKKKMLDKKKRNYVLCKTEWNKVFSRNGQSLQERDLGAAAQCRPFSIQQQKVVKEEGSLTLFIFSSSFFFAACRPSRWCLALSKSTNLRPLLAILFCQGSKNIEIGMKRKKFALVLRFQSYSPTRV